MKKRFLTTFFFLCCFAFSNAQTNSYKKRVLESTEIDFLASYYSQEGDNASVTGGIGTETLTDIAPTIVVNIPLNADAVLTVDIGLSTYTSASSSNLDPFDSSGASEGYGGEESANPNPTGSPWTASSGASRKDTWFSAQSTYSHSSDDRNTIHSAHLSYASEYDYVSYGFGGGVTKLFNEKNTEVGIQAQVYLDKWLPRYPTELDSYVEAERNLNNGFFKAINIYNQKGLLTSKSNSWDSDFTLIDNKNRNTYSVSFSCSQILSKKRHLSLFMDVIQQKGWLANPMQRVYFKDVDNYYVGNPDNMTSNIKKDYVSKKNTDVFQLADDIERLPDTRTKIPLGARWNYYVHEQLSLRSYYRFYSDDWGVNSHTLHLETPIKIKEKYTLYPSIRYYNQSAADYFAAYDEHLSSSSFYTSDYDLAAFNAMQYGLGVSYTDLFTENKIWKFGLKNVDVKYAYYRRNIGLQAHLISLGCKWVLD